MADSIFVLPQQCFPLVMCIAYIGVRGFPARGYFILGRDGGGWWPGKVPCRRRGRRATGPGPGLGQTTMFCVFLLLFSF